MTDSATSVRDRRMAATEQRLTALTRELSAERGFSGFTVEELCELADISRRTFFNYFASKEDALLGHSLRRDDSDLVEIFLAGGEDGGDLSGTLLDDFATLVVGRWVRLDISRDHVKAMKAVFEREPRLLGRMIEKSFEEEQADARLIERREGLPEGDLRAAAAVQIVGALTRASAHQFLRSDASDGADFLEIFDRHLSAARRIFGT